MHWNSIGICKTYCRRPPPEREEVAGLKSQILDVLREDTWRFGSKAEVDGIVAHVCWRFERRRSRARIHTGQTQSSLVVKRRPCRPKRSNPAW